MLKNRTAAPEATRVPMHKSQWLPAIQSQRVRW